MSAEFKVGTIPKTAYLEVEYEKPESVKTEMDVLAEWEKKLEIGSHSEIDMIMDIHKLDNKNALIKYKEINGVDFGTTTEDS